MAMKKLLIMLALSLMICGCSKDDGVADLPEPPRLTLGATGLTGHSILNAGLLSTKKTELKRL